MEHQWCVSVSNSGPKQTKGALHVDRQLVMWSIWNQQTAVHATINKQDPIGSKEGRIRTSAQEEEHEEDGLDEGA